MSARLLVVGARPASLGAAIVRTADAAGLSVATAGVNGEAWHLDLNQMNHADVVRILEEVRPDHVVCTVGVNYGREVVSTPRLWYVDHFTVNAFLPLLLLEAFEDYLRDDVDGPPYRHYVAVSSNSARIPRTASAAYCASKAALSMGIRVRAREVGRSGSPLVVYGYEPGLLAGTPMTAAVEERWGGATLHRMPGVRPAGIDPASVARMMVDNLNGGRELNGCLIPVDAGEV